MERHLLLVYPHPDDECFGSGGTTALHTREGTPVTYLCGTLGEMGRNMGRPFFANRETLPQTRERELRDSCRVLGIGDLRLMGLRDKTVEFEDIEMLAARIAHVIDEVRPSKLMTYYPGHGVHPDHDATAAAVVRALQMTPSERRPVLYCHPVGPKVEELIGPPDLVVDITEVAEVKRASIRAHRSQSEVMFARMEERMAKDPALREQMEQNSKREKFWIYRVD